MIGKSSRGSYFPATSSRRFGQHNPLKIQQPRSRRSAICFGDGTIALHSHSVGSLTQSGPRSGSKPTLVSLTHCPHINLCSEAYTPPSIIYHTRTQILQKHRLTRLQNTSLSSFFETSTIHCDAPEPKEGEVKEG